jgi:hypothetical protein
MLAKAEEQSESHGGCEGSGRAYEKSKQYDRRCGWRKNKYDTYRTRRDVDKLKTKSSDDHKHSDRNEHDRSYPSSRGFQKPRTDDKQENHAVGRSRYSETSWTFQKPKDESIMSGREGTSSQDFSRPEVDGVSAHTNYRSPAASGNWRKRVSENPECPDNPSRMKSCMETPSSASESDDEKEKTTEVPCILTDKEMNDLGARLVKAEILGNEVCIYVSYLDMGNKFELILF